MFAALADGVSEISGYSTGADCRSTLDCLAGLGVAIEDLGRDADGLRLRITGRGLRGLQPPAGVLDAGNSGTTIRMFAGVLAAHPLSATDDRRRVAARPADAARHRAARAHGRHASSPTTAARR